MEKKYSGTAYIGIVGGDLEYGAARDSVQNLKRRQGDSGPVFLRATKGYEARQIQINRFLESSHDFLLLLDHDMVFEGDTLERLRSHGLPYVTGAYMRRQVHPVMAPVWFNDNQDDEWPQSPATEIPAGLVPVAASGWGCILVHREVITSVRQLLKGEWEVLEDDMDIWPYDLPRIMAALGGLQQLIRRPLRAALRWKDVQRYVQTLTEEIRPLTGDKKSVTGSDIRFPFFARQAGYPLMLDPTIRPKHIIHYQLRVNDYEDTPDDYRAEVKRATQENVAKGRQAWRDRMRELGQ